MQRCTELNVTNRSRAYPRRHRKEIQKDEDSFQYSVLREHKYIRLRGQAVKTSPFHGGNTGSIPVGVSQIYADMAQLAEQLICNQQVIGSSPIIGFQP